MRTTLALLNAVGVVVVLGFACAEWRRGERAKAIGSITLAVACVVGALLAINGGPTP